MTFEDNVSKAQHEFYQLSKQYEDYKSINSNKVYNKKRSDVCNWNTYYFS